MLKAALAGKVLQKGKTPVQYQFSEVKHLSRLDSSLEPSKQQDWLWSSFSSSCCHPCCCSGLCVWEEEWASSTQPPSQPLGSISSSSQTLHPGVCWTQGQGWPSLGVLSSHSDPCASSFPRLSNQVPSPAGQTLLLSPCWFLFPNDDFKQPLSREITPPSPTFLLPWIRGFLRTQIT